MPPPIRYVKNGEVSIAYQVSGDGPHDVLVVPGWVSHLALDWEEPYWVRWHDRMGRFARLIRFDKRGTGLSDRPPGIPTLEERMKDARAVLDALDLERVHLLGRSEGGPLSVLLAVAHPERVLNVVLYGTQACFKTKPDYPWGREAAEQQTEIDDFAEIWGSAALGKYFAPDADDRFLDRWANYSRAAASPSAAAAELDVRVRAGVHFGEVLERDGALRGIAVHFAARVMAKAAGGEVLVSETVKDIVAGSGLTFEDRGLHELKGIDGARRLFAVP